MTDPSDETPESITPLDLVLDEIDPGQGDETPEDDVQQALSGEPPPVVITPPTATVDLTGLSLFPFAIQPLPEGFANPPIPTTEPLKVYAPDGAVIALSYDGGASHIRTPEGQQRDAAAKEPTPRTWVAKVIAVVEAETPAICRRVIAPFSAFSRQHVLAGWAPGGMIGGDQIGPCDVFVLPGIGLSPATIAAMRNDGVAKRFLLDVDEPLPGIDIDAEGLGATAAAVDAVTVPTGKMAQQMRRYHPHIYVVPPVIDGDLWRGMAKQVNEKLRIGITNPTGNAKLDFALAQIVERYGDRIEVVPYEWWSLTRLQERAFYPTLDIAIVGDLGPFNSPYPAQIAAAGGCAIVAGRTYGSTVKHGHSGLVAGKTDDHEVWRGHIKTLIDDQRRRMIVGRNARNEVRHYLAHQQLPQTLLPYKLLVAGRIGAPVTHPTDGVRTPMGIDL